MSQQDGKRRVVDDGQPFWVGPTEPQSHTEHQAALAATLFRSVNDPDELVLELESGELRLRESREG